MNWFDKKSIMGLTLGAFVLAGALSPLAIQAASQSAYKQPAAEQQHKIDPAKVAQDMADTFGVNKDDVLKYEKGTPMHDLYKAAFLAKASGKSLKQVMETKKPDNTWKDVAQTLAVTQEKMKATRQDIASTRMENKLGIAKQTSIDLMEQGYHPRDIAVADKLSKNTGKPISDILSMRKINNTWHDVAQSLGVDDNTFKQDMTDIRAAFPHRHFRGGPEHPMMR